jgi:surface polysaccharide O-acyltransferase-like enzyme
MKTRLAVIILYFFAFNLFSQDTIVKVDKTIIISKVLEISPTEISFTLFNSLEGATFKVAKSEISYITYRNGIKELFNTTKENSITKNQHEQANKESNS